jgi:hypothetical protein
MVVVVGGCSASSGSTQEAGVWLKKREVLLPGMKRLPLMAGGVEECAEPDRHVTDIHVEETPSEVVVTASLKVDAARDVGIACEIRNVSAPFIAPLKQPLGARSIVGGFRDARRVISTASRRREVADAAQIRPEQAERFLRRRYPSNTAITCNRYVPERFQCVVTHPDERGVRRHEFPGVLVRAGSHLELDPPTP